MGGRSGNQNRTLLFILAQMLQLNRTIVVQIPENNWLPDLSLCVWLFKIQIFWILLLRVRRYCSGNLLLPSGDNIMATSADNRPPSHWWTPLNLLPSVFLTPLSLFPPLLWPEGQKLRGSELWPFLCCLCVRFTQTSGTCCLSLEWTLSPSSSQSKFELLQLP